MSSIELLAEIRDKHAEGLENEIMLFAQGSNCGRHKLGLFLESVDCHLPVIVTTGTSRDYEND